MRTGLDGIPATMCGDLEATFLVSTSTGIRDVHSVSSSITLIGGEPVGAGSGGSRFI